VEKLLFRPSEAATALGLSRSTVYELIQTGELDSFVVGHKRLIPREALTSWIERQRAVPA